MKHIETDKDEEEEEEENDEKPAVSAMSSSTDGGGGWGASTYFLDPPTGEMVEVQPAPGRVVIMDQDVTHTVSAPSREAGGRPRYSLVWKLAVFPPAPPPKPLQTPPLPSGEEKGSASFAGADAAGSGFLPSAADIVRGGVGRDMVEDGSGSDDISISRPRMSCSTAMIFWGRRRFRPWPWAVPNSRPRKRRGCGGSGSGGKGRTAPPATTAGDRAPRGARRPLRRRGGVLLDACGAS